VPLFCFGWGGSNKRSCLQHHFALQLVMLDDPSFAEGRGLTVHIRTTIRYDCSFIEADAVMIGDKILEVSSCGEHMLNGVSNADVQNTLSDHLVAHSHKSSNKHSFEILVKENRKIVTKAFKDFVSVEIDTELPNSVGILFAPQRGAMAARNGTLIADINEFGQEWQVLASEAMLFHTKHCPQAPERCVLPAEKSMSRRLGEGVSAEAAEKACAHWNAEQMDMCIFDVL